jgi:hypothetical protein
MMKQLRYMVTILLFCVGLTACNNDLPNGLGNPKLCSPNSMPGQQCMTTLDKLMPGQSNVGSYVILMEDGMLSKYEDKCKNGSLEKDLLTRGSDYAHPDLGGHHGVAAPQGIAGVIAPNGRIMLINGHHHSYALELLEKEVKYGKLPECNYDGHVYVYIRENYYNKNYKSEDGSLDRANQYMVGQLVFESWIWLKNANNEQIDFRALPKNLLDMGDDPYRSLIKLVQDDKCNRGSKKNPEFKWQQIINGNSILPFIEFSWGERLRKMKIADIGYDPYRQLPNDFDPKMELQVESSIPSFRKGTPFYIMNPKQCATYSFREKDIKRDKNDGLFRVTARCKDVSTKILRETYNYILQRYPEFTELPGYNYKPIDRSYFCTGHKQD